MQIFPSLSQLLNLSPTHVHHRHIDHALTSRTRLWRHPNQTLAHPYAHVVVGVVTRLLGNQNIIPSTLWYMIAHSAVSSRAPETPSQRRHTSHPPLPRVRCALGIGPGKQATSCYLLTLHKLDKAYKNRASHWVGVSLRDAAHWALAVGGKAGFGQRSLQKAGKPP